MDPFVFGEYPKSMRDIVKERLPKCTEEEKMMIKGSLDFLGTSPLGVFIFKFYF